MNELNINSLLSDEEIVNIRNANGDIIKSIRFHKMSISKALNIAEKYNNIAVTIVDQVKKKARDKTFAELTTEKQVEYILSTNIKNTKKYYNKLIKLCIEIIRPEGLINRIKYYFSKNSVNAKYISRNFNIADVDEFIKLVLKPIMAEKKTMDLKKE